MYTECEVIDNNSTPEKVIERVRTILKDLGTLPMENWGQGTEKRYSLSLHLDGTGIFSKGKGADSAIILADAYVRLAAYLQSFEFMSNEPGMDKSAIEYGGFHFAPDEKLLSMEELMDNDDKWLSVYTGNAAGKDKKDILNIWHSIDFYGSERGFISLPYFDIANGKVRHIPRVMARTICGISATCAGSTGREALLQGLLELAEGYVMRRIISEKITPPTIPESHLKENYPALYGTIKRIESKGDYKVFIKDCSLGKGLPVLGIVFTDRSSHSYSVNYGAHPDFETALEKCLTGLLQGNNFNNSDRLRKFTFGETGQVSRKNGTGLFLNSNGYYPAEFFEETPSYDLAEFKEVNANDGGGMLSYMVDILKANGCDLLVRDVSFLGFPGFHMIAAFSGEKLELNRQFFHELSEMKTAGRSLMHLAKANNSELEQVIGYMNNPDFDPDISIAGFVHKYLGKSFPWAQIKKDIFISSVYYKMGKFKEAYDTMGRYLHLPARRYDMFLNCMKDYYGILTKGINNEPEIRSYLVKFYPENIIDRVISELKNPDEVFKNYASMDCFNCSSCPHIRNCSYPSVEKLYRRLKERYAANPIDQESVMRYMNLQDKRPT